VRTLAEVPSDQNFYGTLGTVVLLLDIVSGAAVSVAVGYMVGVPATQVWWVGLAWTVVLAFGVERLVLQVASGTRRRSLAVVLVPRLILSLMLALVVAEPLLARIFQSEISAQLSKTQSAAIQSAVGNDTSFYGGKIRSDRRAIATIRTNENALRGAAAHDTFISNCERLGEACSITHHAGCGAYCEHYTQLAQNANAEVKAIQPGDRARISALQSDIRRLQGLETAANLSRPSAIASSGGLLSREEALQQLAKGHPIVTEETWFIRLLLIFLDLTPLFCKVGYVLTTESPYERLCAARRRTDCAAAKRHEVAADLDEVLIAEQKSADLEVERVRIRLDRERRINELYAEAGIPPFEAASSGELVQARSLQNFADEMETHDARPVPMPPGLRRGGRVGMTLISATAVVAGLLSVVSNRLVVGSLELALVLGLVAALAAYTRGFRHAPAWALRATLATLAIGLVAPLAMLAINF
jgi:hypothetical protein